MSSLNVEEDQQWVPTHVQVTVLRGRGLRGKGKHGTSDVYTIIQLGKEKYSTCVLEKTTEPEWKEECSFELQPGVMDSGTGSNELVLTVMHRALIGLDVFLGQTVILLDKVYREGRCVKNEWYRLNSKTGKKEKERGEVQVNVQFTRNNMTASMYDLVMKDKGASTFVKLKERIKGKKRPSDEDSSSAVLPGGYGSLCRMRQRLPSDGGGEEDYEDDEGGEVRRSKMRTFFLRGKLRKSSDTRSSTSLGSESSESSRGGSLSPTAGISVVVSDLSNSPSNSSNLTADNSPEHTANTSSSSLKCEFGDDAGEITIAVPQRTVCVNGSHAYIVQPPDPGSGKPQNSFGLGLLQKTLPLSISLQNLSPRTSTDTRTGAVGDGRRWSFDKPGEEEKAAIAAALEQSGPMRCDEEEEEERAAQDALPKSAASTADSDTQGKKQRRNLFSHGRGGSAKDESQQASAATQEKQRGWFGSKDGNAKPSLVVSPTLDPSTHPHQPVLLPSHHPMGPSVDPTSPVSPLHHTNPFCHSQSTTPPLSPCNPFFSVLQHNPFYEDMLTAQPLKLALPPLQHLCSSRPPIDHFFPHAINPNLTPTRDNPTAECSLYARKEVQARPLPPTPTEGETTFSKRSSNPFMCPRELELDSEWDESFAAFAAGRLQSPEEGAPVCKTRQNLHPPVLGHNKATGQPKIDADQNTNVKDVPHQQTCTEFGIKANKATCQMTNTYNFDAFAQFLETIPENTSFESDNRTSDTLPDSQTLTACDKTNQANSTTNTGMVYISSVKPNSGSPDPGSSGLGSSAEEDLLSFLSSYSDKFSASSSEEAEQSRILNFEKSSELGLVTQPSDSEDDITDRSNGLSLVDLDQDTIIQHRDGDVSVDYEGSSAQRSSALMDRHLVVTAGETLESEFPDLESNANVCFQAEDEHGKKDAGESYRSLEGFSTELSLSVTNATDVTTATSTDGELSSINPSFHITTSSPETRQGSSDLPVVSLGGQDASGPSPIPFTPFGHFLNTNHIAISPSQSFDETLLHTQMSNQNTSSFLQSFYLTVDSQEYQSCESQLSPKYTGDSEPNETLHSANTSVCGDLKEIQSTANTSLGKTRRELTNQTDQLEEFFCLANTPTLEPSFRRGNGLEELHDELSPQSTTLHRSQSEGTLTAVFNELLLPSFGSDPGATREEFPLSQPGPDITSLTSFAPSLTPDRSSSPVALCSLPAFADPTAKSPTSMAGGAVQKSTPPETQPQQQAEDLQKSPHPVKPLGADLLAEEKRTENRSVLATGLEKLKSTINPGRSSQLSEQDTDKKKPGTEGAGSYYHLNHSELVALLVQREAELERQREESERQKRLLAKRELELKKLKPQVQDLEDYIDTLLVRIMEQKPTLLQVGSKLK